MLYASGLPEKLRPIFNKSVENLGILTNYDLSQDEKQVTYTFAMPGFTLEQIKVCTEDNFLVVSAKRDQSSSFQTIKNEINERIQTPVTRPQKISAVYRDGLLTVQIMKNPVEVHNVLVTR